MVFVLHSLRMKPHSALIQCMQALRDPGDGLAPRGPFFAIMEVINKLDNHPSYDRHDVLPDLPRQLQRHLAALIRGVIEERGGLDQSEEINAAYKAVDTCITQFEEKTRSYRDTMPDYVWDQPEFAEGKVRHPTLEEIRSVINRVLNEIGVPSATRVIRSP
jgi:hypothetical protein